MRSNPPRLLESMIQAAPPGPAREYLESAVPVMADEPMQWYFEESDKEYWHEPDEFLNVAPPYDLLWIEFRAPRFSRSEVTGIVPWDGSWSRAAVLFKAVPREESASELQEWWPGAKWILRGVVFADNEGPAGGMPMFGAPGPKWEYICGVGERGELLTTPSGDFRSGPAWGQEPPPQITHLLKEYWVNPWRVGLLAIYFMHAKGTELRQERVPAKVRRAREKKGRFPGVDYKILDVGMAARQSRKPRPRARAAVAR